MKSLLPDLYRKALLLYPADFRNQFGGEMEECFREDWRRAGGGFFFAIRVLTDIAISAPTVHFDMLRQDARYASRTLIRLRGFSIATIATLGLGIGAASLMLTLVNSILIRPLSLPEPDRLLTIWEKNPRGIERNSVSPPDFVDFRNARSLQSATAFYADEVNLTLKGGTEHVTSYVVSPEFFDVLQVKPMSGTVKPMPVTGPGAEPSAMLSYSLWERSFGGDLAVVGKTLPIDGKAYTIRGVMPRAFHFPSADAAVWTNMSFDPARFSRQAHFLVVLGRLRPSVSTEQARAELGVIAAGLSNAFPASNRDWGVTVLPLREQAVGETRRPLLIFFAATGLVLLIACGNAANLLLAHVRGKRVEMAVRSALGATVGRIARQVVMEGLLLALAGGIAGLGLAALALAQLKLLRPASIPRLDEVSINGSIATAVIGISLLTGWIVAALPARRISRADMNTEMKDNSHRFRGLVILSEVAMALLLTAGAGLLIRTVVELTRLNPGFNASGAATMKLDLPAPQRVALMEKAVAAAQSVRGVTAAGMISNLPLTGGEGFNRFGFSIDGVEGSQRFYGRWLTPGYLRAMEIPLLRGRDFSNFDREGSAPVVIVDAALARRYFPGVNPVGKLVRLSYAPEERREIVGVAGEVRLIGLDAEPAPQIYIPALQEPRSPSMTMVVRTELAPRVAAETVRSELGRAMGTVPIYDIRPLSDVVADSIAARRFRTQVLAVLAGLALCLAAVGVFGVVNCMVGERMREIGIRVALGAGPPQILSMVIRQGMSWAAAGTVCGVAAAALLTRALATLLYGVHRLDPWTFAAAASTTLLVSFVACLIPAVKGASADPNRVLRK